MLKRIFTDPLILFLIAGGGLFALDQWRGPGDEGKLQGEGTAGDENRIIITDSVFAQLEEGFSSRWRRPPTPVELKGLLDAHIREEVLFREALNLGLDRDDTIIRRRLAQKMEFLTSDLANLAQPTDEELEEYYLENADRYQRPPSFSFTQIYFNTDRRGDAARADAEAVLEKLRAGKATAKDAIAGADNSMLQIEFADASMTEVGRRFGGEFAEGLDALKIGEWGGPVDSAFGTHLVLISAKDAAVLPEFEVARARVQTDFMAERRKEMNQSFLEELLSKYEVVIEGGGEGEAENQPPEPATAGGSDLTGGEP